MSDKITILRGAEKVRRRPTVIFGSANIDGVLEAVQMLLDVFINECANGYTNELTVTQYLDNSVSLQDNGRGLYLDNGVWKDLFCELFAGSPYEASAPSLFDAPAENSAPGDSFELCAVQYASAYMDAWVVRDGFRYDLHFEKGENIGGLKKAASYESTGTYIRFKPDPEVFCETHLPDRSLMEKALSVALQLPGVRVLFRQETTDGFTTKQFCYPEGVADFLRARNNGHEVSPIFTITLEAEGQDRYNQPKYAAKVTVGLCFRKDKGFQLCYHNYKELPCGGSHMDALLRQLTRFLNWLLTQQVHKEDLLQHMQLVVITQTGHTAWSSGAKTSIYSPFLRDLTQDTIDNDFRDFVVENQDFLNDLFQH